MTATKDDLIRKFEMLHVRPKPGAVLIVGSRLYGDREDRRRRHAKAIGIDMQPGPGVDRVLDLEQSLPKGFGPFAHIECCSVLEHSRRPWLLAANLEKLLQTSGTLYLTAPFIWRIHGYPNDYWRFTLDGIRELFPAIGWQPLMFAHIKLTVKSLVPARGSAERDCPLLPRTECVGFGVRA